MSKRYARRLAACGAALWGLAGCASVSVHDVAWGPVDGPLCEVRVESGYGTPVEARALAGGREIDLGVVEPESAHAFSVPCAHRAVTVYRVVPAGPSSENHLDARAQALVVDRTTVVTIRPPATRRSAASLPTRQ